MKAAINTDNSISIRNDYVHYDSRHGTLPLVANLSELFMKFFGNNDCMETMSKLLDIEIVAVMKQPYGKHSTFFRNHHTHRFDILIVSYGLNKIKNAKPLSSLNTLSDDSLILEIPIYIDDMCIGCIICGPFYMSKETASSDTSSSVPVIIPSKLNIMTHKICEAGNTILADCVKYQRHPNNIKKIEINPETLFNYGNIFLFDILTDTYVISPDICDIFGYNYTHRYTFADFIAMIIEEDRQRIVQFCKQNILLGSKDYVIETTITRLTDGQIVDIEISGAIIKDKNGRSIQTIGSVKDVTELNRTHAKLCEEVANKNRLIKIIGHDLKNPFNGMIGFSELLKLNLEQRNYEEATEYSEIIKQAASEGYELLVNLLDYSTSQSGDMITVKKEFDVFKTVDSILKLSSAQALKKGITLCNQINEPTICFSDENKINTILRNLISNAIKFCYQDGIIMIRATIHDGKMIISISDTGESISATKLKSINSAHDVSSTNGTDSESGTSIGLRLCHTYLKALGSHLVATSDDGVTTFEFAIEANTNNEE
ncbi:MAG: PAS domain-containing sensor histidine kinase [Bacteroidales bacterium]|nr:PAS domain-containing sensor histidine kinase [Bacteroidales bacterium]